MDDNACQSEGHGVQDGSCKVLPIPQEIHVTVPRSKEEVARHPTRNLYQKRPHFGRTPTIPMDVLRTRLGEDCFYKPKPKKISLKSEKMEKMEGDTLQPDGADNDNDETSGSPKRQNSAPTPDLDDGEIKTFVIFRSSTQDLARAKKAIASGKKLRESQDPGEPIPPTLFTNSVELSPAEKEHLELRSNPELSTRVVVRQTEAEYKKNQAEFRERERERKMKRNQKIDRKSSG